jgi:hypothetical protein
MRLYFTEIQIFCERSPRNTINIFKKFWAERENMLIKKIAILAIIVLSVIGITILMPREKPFEELKLEIIEVTYPETGNGASSAIIEFTIKNNNPYSVSLSNAKLVSFLGENKLGSISIDEINVDADSETQIRVEVQEDWSKVPANEPNLTPEYSFQANIDNIGNLEITQIKPLQRTIIPLPIDEKDPKEDISDSYLDEFYDNIRSGGPPKDGIPPIDRPIYITLNEADDKLGYQDIMFVMDTGGQVYLYPQKILVWHEIVNEEIDGIKYSLTYCPLTGSAIGYYGTLEGLETSFGTSGKLINSNLVMYDRETDSYWPQILGIYIKGEKKGESLETFNVVWSRWGLVKATYPNALVLSEETGFFRSYGSDPYGEYSDSNSYYNEGKPFFPIMNTDPRLDLKEVVIGIKIEGIPYAITKKEVSENQVVNIDAHNKPLVAFYNKELDSVNIFYRSHENDVHSFELKDGNIIDDDTDSIWRSDGTCVSGEFIGNKLEPADHFDVMWFGWAAFYPTTGLYGE